MVRVLKYISIKPRTRKEVKDYIDKKFHLSEKDIDEVIEYLSRNGFLDDEFIKTSYISSKTAKGFGRKYIKYKLLSKGVKVGDDEISINLDKIVDIVKKKYGKEVNEENLVKVKSKVFNFLSYRGFTKKEIDEIMKKVFD